MREVVLPPPGWWGQPYYRRRRHVHIINDCPDADTMRQMASLAIQRQAYTIWITTTREDPDLGAVYDELPPYWADEVKFFHEA